MTNPTKPALDLDELEAAVKNAMVAHPNDDYFLFDDLVTPPTVIALIEAARERDTLRAQLTQAQRFLGFSEQTLLAQLAQAREALESIRIKLSYAGQDVPSRAVAAFNVNQAFHECIQALAAITPAASTEDKS